MIVLQTPTFWENFGKNMRKIRISYEFGIILAYRRAIAIFSIKIFQNSSIVCYVFFIFLQMVFILFPEWNSVFHNKIR